MTVELAALFGASLLLLVLLMVQGALTPAVQGFAWGLGARDEPRERSVLQRRFDRIVANQIEALAVFAGLVVVATLAGVSTPATEAGAVLFLAGRVGFAAVYAAGLPYVRSLLWGIATLGLLMIAWAVATAAPG